MLVAERISGSLRLLGSRNRARGNPVVTPVEICAFGAE
jgi:hypothetical protein